MRILRWFFNIILVPLIIAIIGGIIAIIFLLPEFPIYYKAFRTEIYLILFTVILLIVLLFLFERHRERLKAERERIESEKKRIEELLSEFKKNFVLARPEVLLK